MYACSRESVTRAPILRDRGSQLEFINEVVERLKDEYQWDYGRALSRENRREPPYLKWLMVSLETYAQGSRIIYAFIDDGIFGMIAR